jgi:hypothetical protein
MLKKYCSRALVLSAMFAAAASAGVPDRRLYVLSDTNTLATSDESQPTTTTAPLPVTGLSPGDSLQAIDVRPSNGRLYGLGANPGAGTAQLYHLSVGSSSVLATAVGTTGTFVDAIGNPVPITANAFGFDFNPAVDRIRVVSGDGRNFRMNPNTGSFVDGDLGGAAGSVAGLNMDGPLNAAATTAQACAYTNNRINTTVTTLYTVDETTNQLMIQNPPNAGVQTMAQLITLNGSTLDLGSETGFDIPPGVDVVTSNSAAAGIGYLVSMVGGSSGFYRLNLADATTSLVGTFSAFVARDIAISTNPTGLIANATPPQLARFPLGQPQSAVTVSLTGLNAGETLVGVDGRPATGAVYALGINATSDNGTVYLVDPQTGAMSTVGGTPGLIAFVDGTGNPVDLPNTAYGVDFNPAVDRIRVTSLGGGLNFRLNPNGMPVDGDLGGPAGSVAGTNTDAGINGSGVTGTSGSAYTNNFAGTTVTTLYTLDPNGDRLAIQNPPNAGTQTMTLSLTANGTLFDFQDSAGFDIPPGVNVAASNQAAAGFAYVTLASATQSGLFRLELSNGQLSFIGAAPIAADGVIAWQGEIDPIFFDGFE